MTANQPIAAIARHAPWREMTRIELDAAYDNSAHVRDSAAKLAGWAQRSERLRALHPGRLNRRYGPLPRNVIDIFSCGVSGAPLLVFIHGGYWQRNSKEVFSCMAEGPLTAGFDVALPGYTLAPDMGLTGIVAEIRAALIWLRREGPALGVASGQLIVSGWSAGGHLATLAMSWPEVDAGLSISGLYDLEPIRLGTLNDKLGLSPADALALSPVRHLPRRAGQLAVAYGMAELPELQRQSRDFFASWTSAGLEGNLLPLDDRNHFSVLDELATPDGRLARALHHLVR